MDNVAASKNGLRRWPNHSEQHQLGSALRESSKSSRLRPQRCLPKTRDRGLRSWISPIEDHQIERNSGESVPLHFFMRCLKSTPHNHADSKISTKGLCLGYKNQCWHRRRTIFLNPIYCGHRVSYPQFIVVCRYPLFVLSQLETLLLTTKNLGVGCGQKW